MIHTHTHSRQMRHYQSELPFPCQLQVNQLHNNNLIATKELLFTHINAYLFHFETVQFMVYCSQLTIRVWFFLHCTGIFDEINSALLVELTKRVMVDWVKLLPFYPRCAVSIHRIVFNCLTL